MNKHLNGARVYRKKPETIVARVAKQVELFSSALGNGTLHANAGDYIITLPNGKEAPMKKELFEKLYECIEGEDVHGGKMIGRSHGM